MPFFKASLLTILKENSSHADFKFAKCPANDSRYLAFSLAAEFCSPIAVFVALSAVSKLFMVAKKTSI